MDDAENYIQRFANFQTKQNTCFDVYFYDIIAMYKTMSVCFFCYAITVFLRYMYINAK